MPNTQKFDNQKKIEAIALLAEGKSLREVAKLTGVSKSLIAMWKEQAETISVADVKASDILEQPKPDYKEFNYENDEIKQQYKEYVDSLKAIRDRQGKWAGAISETGIRTLKFANRFLAKVETKQEITKGELDLIKIIPNLLTSSASAIKSAAEAEDRIYVLDVIASKLDDLPQQIEANQRRAQIRAMAAEYKQ